MVVVIIIAALAGMVLPHLMPATENAKSKIAAVDINANITTALKMYRLHIGRYPTTEEGLAVLLKPAKEYNNEPFLDKPALDPWGRKYDYRYPGTHNTTGFDLSSQGPDPQKADDDITNWDTTGK